MAMVIGRNGGEPFDFQVGPQALVNLALSTGTATQETSVYKTEANDSTSSTTEDY